MKLLNEISEFTLGIGDPEKLNSNYELRKSARAILLNKDGNIAIQYLQNYTFHKLPGGGVEIGENLKEAVIREVEEEVGCKCEISDTVGMVIEYRNKYNLLHISYAFVAKIIGKVGTPKLEKGEIEEGQVTVWMPVEEALEKMEIDQPKKYEGFFILEREKSFLKEYLKMN
jgi:8-oxo-dGTP diphosphatase